jgi:4-amino-4-deoxy-L-arabinose transferase-like glycosyltransferase
MQSNTRAIRKWVWAIAIVLASVQAWTSRHFVNPDGVSYLDLSDDYAAGRWSAAINGYWSPLYPTLLAAMRAVVHPTPFMEATAVHFLNAVLFLAGLAAFELLLRELRVDDALKRIAAYAIFLFAGLSLISIRVITPDMMLLIWCCIIAALVVREIRGDAGVGTFALLGVVLGLAYLTKAIMFPIGVCILAVTVFFTRQQRSIASRHLIAIAIFLVVAAPQLYAMSRLAGHPSFGDAGRIAYARKVNELPKHWVDPASNAIRLLHEKPDFYAFPLDKPSRSFPLWDEPAVWYRGMPAHFDLKQQARAIVSTTDANINSLQKIIFPVLLLVIVAGLSLDRERRALVIIAGLAMALYEFVYTEPRLIGPWVAIGFAAILTASQFPGDEKRKRIAQWTLIAVVTVCGISVVRAANRGIATAGDETGFGAVNSQWIVAQKLAALHVSAGSRVALIGDESDIYWARLAGVQVAYQVPLPSAPTYWKLSAPDREKLDADLEKVGATAIVASWSAPESPIPGWIPVGDRHYLIRPLNAAVSTH